MQSSINAHIIYRHENRHRIGYNYAYVEKVIVEWWLKWTLIRIDVRFCRLPFLNKLFWFFFWKTTRLAINPFRIKLIGVQSTQGVETKCCTQARFAHWCQHWPSDGVSTWVCWDKGNHLIDITRQSLSIAAFLKRIVLFV